ncbi:hypothetical protein JFL47_02585 [Haemophilus haemoglobinophilus]|nr:hypothetical protein [Canicola haemoglobinophilus]
MYKLFSLITLFFSISVNAEQIRSIDIYVLPYYEAQNGKAIMVNIDPNFDHLLLENTTEGYKKVVEIVKNSSGGIHPVLLFALSARAYDLGFRDEAVFWFYVARQRLLVLNHVAELPRMLMAEYNGFNQLVKGHVLAYAFCDMDKQEKILAEAYKWTRDNPYLALLHEDVPSKFSDRQKGLEDAQKMLDKRQQEQKTVFSDPAMIAKIKKSREEMNADKLFCW